ncbi:unnamed protein product [Discula destructiva]
MGRVINGWGAATGLSLSKLFDGSPDSLDIPEKATSNGRMVEAGRMVNPLPDSDVPADPALDLQAHIQKTFFGFTIPALWSVSSVYAFVIDSGFPCDSGKPLKDYLDDSTMDKTGMCFDGMLFYLVSPEGESQFCSTSGSPVCHNRKFSAPSGIDSLGSEAFGGIWAKEDLISGAVRTYRQNGNANGGGPADPTNPGTINDLFDRLDITTPGFIRLPVFSAGRAFESWAKGDKGSTPNFPCDRLPGKNSCSVATFVDQTSGGSPKVEDCRQIITIIQDDIQTDWTTQVAGGSQRKIASFGSCRFGIEATKIDGNVSFTVGGQDVIDIIIGRVGAKGIMQYNGNIKGQQVEWGIY